MARSRSKRKNRARKPGIGLDVLNWFEVIRVRREPVGRDPLGNIVMTDVKTPVGVAGWAEPVGSEPKLAGHDRRVVQIELFAPVGVFRETDGVILPGWTQTLEVIGAPGNYEHNPFGWSPGLEVVNLGGIE